jgi:hypothetical protein
MSQTSVQIEYDRDQFYQLVKTFAWQRKIDAVHMHHTWQPDHSQWKGAASQIAMYDYHVKNLGWQDIAQHVTIAPDGGIWGGRDWNMTPASQPGHNPGAFMFEMVGNFDAGHDRLEGEQLKSALHVTAVIQWRFSLQLQSLRFHNQLNSPKTCPGNTVDYNQILGELEAYRDWQLPQYK